MNLPPRVKHLLRRHALQGGFRPFAAPLYSGLVALELWIERMLDALDRPEPSPRAALRGNLTVLIKTFERPNVLKRLLASITRFYPELPTVVVDDSRAPSRLEGVLMVTMPYDSGISAGRNEGLRHVETKYVLLLDDDFVFFRHNGLGPALDSMEQNPEIDIMGGEVIDLPLFRAQRVPRDGLFPTSAVPARPLGSFISGLTVCAKVPNFFVARTARLRLVPWEPRLKRMEHADFFTRALGVLTTVFNPRLKCLHAPTPFDRAYMSKRLDLAEASALLAERYGVGARRPGPHLGRKPETGPRDRNPSPD